MTILRKIGWNSIGQISHTAYVFGSIPLILNTLGDSSYGYIVFLNHVIALTAFFDLGLSLKIYVDASGGRLETSHLKTMLEKYIGIGFWVGLFALVYGFVNAQFGDMTLSYQLLLLITLVVFTSWPRSMYRSALLGASNEKFFNIIYASGDILKILLIILLNWIPGGGPESLLFIFLVVNTVEMAAYHFRLTAVYDLKLKLAFTKLKAPWRENDFFSFTLLSIMLMQVLFFWVSVTQGELGLSFLGLLMLPISAMTTVFFPITTAMTNLFSKNSLFSDSFADLWRYRFSIFGSVIFLIAAALSAYNAFYHGVIDDSVDVPSFNEYLAMTVSGTFILGSNLIGVIFVSHRRAGSLSWCYIVAIMLILGSLVFGQSLVSAISLGSLTLFSTHCIALHRELRKAG